MTDHIERLRGWVNYGENYASYGQLVLIPQLHTDVSALLAERDSLAALLAEAELCVSAVYPFLIGMSKNPTAQFNEGTRAWMTRRGEECDAFLSKIAQQKGESDA